MKTELRMESHSISGKAVVEIWHDGQLIGCIYGDDGWLGLRP